MAALVNVAYLRGKLADARKAEARSLAEAVKRFGPKKGRLIVRRAMLERAIKLCEDNPDIRAVRLMRSGFKRDLAALLEKHKKSVHRQSSRHIRSNYRRKACKS